MFKRIAYYLTLEQQILNGSMCFLTVLLLKALAFKLLKFDGLNVTNS